MININENIENFNKEYPQKKDNNFIYYGLIFYTIIFYTHIAGRLPFLAPFRIEFILGTCLLLFVINKLLKGNIKLDENKLNIIIFMFILVLITSVIFAYVHMRALTTFIRVFKFFAIYLMIIAAIDTEKKLKGFITVYLIMICLLFVEPFLLSLQGKGFIYNNHMWRLAGATEQFGHPNALGMITASNLPFLYYLIKYNQSKIVKLTSVGLIIIAIRVIMLTQSRTAFVGLITCVFAIWISSKKYLLGSVIAVICLALIWTYAPQQTKNRFTTFGKTFYILEHDREDLTQEEITSLGSMNSRWQLMRLSFIAFKENPIIGLGLDCFASFSGRRWRIWMPPHNTYLQALAETGTIGFISLLLVIIYTFKNLLEARDHLKQFRIKDPFLKYTIYSVSLYYFTYLVVSFFGIEYYNNFWWIAGGLSVVVLRIIKMKTKSLQYPALNKLKVLQNNYSS